MENLYKFTSIAQSSDTHPQYPHAKHIANHACSGIDIEWVGTTTKYAPVWCESAWHQIQRRKKKHKYNRQWTGHTSFTYTIWFHVCVCLWVVFRDVAGWLSGFLFFFFFLFLLSTIIAMRVCCKWKGVRTVLLLHGCHVMTFLFSSLCSILRSIFFFFSL